MKQFLSCLMVLVLGLATWIFEPAPTLSQSLAGVHPIGTSYFEKPTARIFFDEISSYDHDPVYTPDLYGANDTAPTITFKALFEGQSYSRNPSQDCRGATPLGCVIGKLNNPLTLSNDLRVRGAEIVSNSELSRGRGLGTQENAAYGILFDKDVTSVGVTIVGFDAVGSTAIKVFDRAGNLLGQTTNSKTGTEFVGFATNNNEDKIAGLQVSMIGPEEEGYLIGDITFVQKAYKPTVKLPKGAHAVEASHFKQSTAQINFDEVPIASYEPIYTPNIYGANNSAPTLTFRNLFAGQSYSRKTVQDCQGALPLGCIIGQSSNPLSPSDDLRVRGGEVIENSDLSKGRGLGTQQNAAYGIFFDKDVASVGLTVGPFDTKDNTAIKVFDRTGKLLGQATNQQTGYQFFGFATDDGEDKIAGVQVSAIAPDNGYYIGDIAFVQKGYTPTNRPPVVEVSIPGQKATENKAFNFTLPANTFIDPDGDALTLSASLANSNPLPSWLTFNPTTRQFSGTPPKGSRGSLAIAVTATDPKGSSVSTTFTLTIEPAPACEAPSILNPANNHCYSLTDVLTWPKAREAARNAGGYLATINDEGEQNWLINTFDSQTVPGNPPSFWIGFTDVNSPGKYQWVNGEPVTYTNWNTLWGEPNNHENLNEHYADFCVRVGFLCPQVGVWNDRPDGWPQLKGIIEIEQP
ncbi:MAG: putative Ig domain-containing protein [Actinomycetota bacterium]